MEMVVAGLKIGLREELSFDGAGVSTELYPTYVRSLQVTPMKAVAARQFLNPMNCSQVQAKYALAGCNGLELACMLIYLTSMQRLAEFQHKQTK
jgi:hypothetical protein